MEQLALTGLPPDGSGQGQQAINLGIGLSAIEVQWVMRDGFALPSWATRDDNQTDIALQPGQYLAVCQFGVTLDAAAAASGRGVNANLQLTYGILGWGGTGG